MNCRWWSDFCVVSVEVERGIFGGFEIRVRLRLSGQTQFGSDVAVDKCAVLKSRPAFFKSAANSRVPVGEGEDVFALLQMAWGKAFFDHAPFVYGVDVFGAIRLMKGNISKEKSP